MLQPFKPKKHGINYEGSGGGGAPQPSLLCIIIHQSDKLVEVMITNPPPWPPPFKEHSIIGVTQWKISLNE